MSASGPYAGRVLRPSDGDVPEKVAFIQCVGSRDYTGKGKPYCSSVCCMYTAKEAVIAHEHMHQIHPTIFSMDVRAYGKDFDKYIKRAQEEYGVQYIRSRISSITEVPETNDLRIRYETEEGKVIDIGIFTSPDLVSYWNSTKYVTIKNKKNLYLKYAELADVIVKVNQLIKPGQLIGQIGTVLKFKKINEKSPKYIQKIKLENKMSMLHFEIYNSKPNETKNYLGGNWFDKFKPDNLLDPIDYLK